jgi:transcriptional regulator with XRE-family HTH domain
MQHLSDLPTLGAEVARLRKEKGLTQKELGELSGLGQSTIARFETGRVSEFGSRKLLRLLEVLGHALTTVPLTRKFTLDDALEEKQREAGQR